MTRKPPAAKALIHEIDSVRRQHRIVMVIGGVPQRGEWADLNQLATFKTLTAAAHEFTGLPKGIFQAVSRPHEVLE